MPSCLPKSAELATRADPDSADIAHAARTFDRLAAIAAYGPTARALVTRALSTHTR